MINTFLTVSVLLTSEEIIPYFLAMTPFWSAIIGKGTRIPVLQKMSYTQAKWDALLSTLSPIRQVFRLLKYGFALAKAIISVVHTGVKYASLGVFKSFY